MVNALEQGYVWARAQRRIQLRKKDFITYYREFCRHHAHARGIIFYGYWGEPIITQRIKTILSKAISADQVDRVTSLISTPHQTSGELKRLYVVSPASIHERQSLLKTMELSARTRELVDILSWCTYFYEVGERVASYMHDQFIQKLERYVEDRKVMQELDWYDPRSFDSFLRGRRLSDIELRARQHFFVLRMMNGRWSILSGPAARTFYQAHLMEKVSSRMIQLHGVTASPGKVRGVVRIVHTQADQHKMKQGDILVSPMTTPKLMTAVHQAAAIVTDEGGMTAHAAIVAREMSIPCVTGTKYATQIFKDGDRVEVDADRGIVRKV
jgi:phosphohistidine swiveling domain-containing protein